VLGLDITGGDDTTLALCINSDSVRVLLDGSMHAKTPVKDVSAYCKDGMIWADALAQDKDKLSSDT
jgi:hypothetical protein